MSSSTFRQQCAISGLVATPRRAFMSQKKHSRKLPVWGLPVEGGGEMRVLRSRMMKPSRAPAIQIIGNHGSPLRTLHQEPNKKRFIRRSSSVIAASAMLDEPDLSMIALHRQRCPSNFCRALAVAGARILGSSWR